MGSSFLGKQCQCGVSKVETALPCPRVSGGGAQEGAQADKMEKQDETLCFHAERDG